jgi:tetratricopeptide (TPR) repeat protein
VRVAAIEAVGELGEQDADLESVLTRLNPTIETNELARDGAWEAFQRLLDKKPLDVQLAWSERLREMPDLEIRHLQALLAKAARLNGNNAHVASACDRLATVFVSQGKYADALSHLRQLYELSATSTKHAVKEVGPRWLEAALRVPGTTDVADVVTQIAEGADRETLTHIVETVARYFDSTEEAAEIEHARAVLVQLESIKSGALGEDWRTMLQQVAERIAAPVEQATPTP